MTRNWKVAGVGLLGIALAALLSAPAAQAQPQEQQQGLGYTMPEYQAYKKALDDTDPQQRIKDLDDFVAKYPNASPKLMLPALRLYFTTYFGLKNYPKAIEFIDKMFASPGANQLDALSCVEAYYARTQAFYIVFNEKAPDAKDQATKARDAALQGLKQVSDLPKPENVTPEQLAEAKKQYNYLFNYTAAFTSASLKDFKTAVDSYKAALAVKSDDPLTYYRLGLVYLQMDPPQTLDGFWALARSIAMKGPSEGQIRTYLRAQIVRYQQTVTCDKLTDAEMNEMIQLAANSPERPASYSLTTADDLKKATAEGSNFFLDLKAGGDKAKITWLAVCGLEFPEVGGKVIEVAGDTPIVLKVFYAPTPEEIEAGTVPNMEAKVDGQPEAKRLQAGDPVRFSGTLVSYDAEPFMLHFEKAKVKAEDIPAEQKQPGKTPAKRPPKKPGGR